MTNTHRPISLLITDLDNTLYDWVTFFSRSFEALAREACRILEIPREQLYTEIKAVNQEVGDSEYAYALFQTHTAKQRLAGLPFGERQRLLQPALDAFEQEKECVLKAYPGVEQVLRAAVNAGVPVVAHTESMVPNALSRLRHLKLSRYFDALYALEVPWMAEEQVFDDGQYGTPKPAVIPLQSHQRKPNPKVLREIAAGYDCPMERVLYVGDSLSRDMAMAAETGAVGAWARYGSHFDQADWDRLVQITHWTEADVKRAEALRRRHAHVHPDLVLEAGFDELRNHVIFEPRGCLRPVQAPPLQETLIVH